MEIKTLEGISIAAIAEAFNSAFSDYLVPIALTEKDLQAKMAMENTKPEYSVGVFSGGQLVGFILTGIDGNLAYNGGTGVIPAFRGQNLTQEMYGFLIPLLAQKGIAKHKLEVITENVRAIPIYQKIGFETVRTVDCFKGKIRKPENNRAELTEISFSAIENPRAFWDFEPTYQNRAAAILRAPELHQAFGAYVNGNLAGYIVSGKDNGRVKQFAVDKAFRNQGIGHRLFYKVQESAGENPISLINVDRSDACIAFLEKIGLKKTVSQFEMTLG